MIFNLTSIRCYAKQIDDMLTIIRFRKTIKQANLFFYLFGKSGSCPSWRATFAERRWSYLNSKLIGFGIPASTTSKIPSTWGQFHQHFRNKFFVQKCFAQIFFIYISALWLFGTKNISDKSTSKMLMKLTPVVNYITMLQTDFVPIYLWLMKIWQYFTKPYLT